MWRQEEEEDGPRGRWQQSVLFQSVFFKSVYVKSVFLKVYFSKVAAGGGRWSVWQMAALPALPVVKFRF